LSLGFQAFTLRLHI